MNGRIIFNLTRLCIARNFNPDKFNEKNVNLSVSSALAEHVAWAFDNIYSIPYPGRSSAPYSRGPINNSIARVYHGIQHVTRAAKYLRVFANLYARYGDLDALNLTEEEIKLLEIAAILHDSARLGEGKDEWDLQSATLLYKYLTTVLGYDKEKSKEIAEAMANKDANPPKPYFELIVNNEDSFEWQKSEFRPKNIYQKLLQNVDCLDIHRARAAFNAYYLDFFHDFGKYNTQAFDEMAQLITEARSLIEAQGDGYNRINIRKKLEFEHVQAFEAITRSINDPAKHYPVMRALGGECLLEAALPILDTTPYDEAKELTLENLKAALRTELVLARSVCSPTAYFSDLGNNIVLLGAKEIETFGQKEIRKTGRRPEVPTRARHNEKRLGKHGNTVRSCSTIGWGGSVFADAGFILIKPPIRNIKKVSKLNIGAFKSGYGKKTHLRQTLKDEKISEDSNSLQLCELRVKQKMGGSAGRLNNTVATHTEIICDIQEFDAIYFTRDPNFYNKATSDNSYARHEFTPVLQAIYLQNEYRKIIGKLLPIFEYSGIDNDVREAKTSEEDIKNMWVAMCSQYIKDKLYGITIDTAGDINELSLDAIKVSSMHRTTQTLTPSDALLPADINYGETLKTEINELILKEKAKIINEFKKEQEEKLAQLELKHEAAIAKHEPEFIALSKQLAPLVGKEQLYQRRHQAPFDPPKLTRYGDFYLSIAHESSEENLYFVLHIRCDDYCTRAYKFRTCPPPEKLDPMGRNIYYYVDENGRQLQLPLTSLLIKIVTSMPTMGIFRKRELVRMFNEMNLLDEYDYFIKNNTPEQNNNLSHLKPDLCLAAVKFNRPEIVDSFVSNNALSPEEYYKILLYFADEMRDTFTTFLPYLNKVLLFLLENYSDKNKEKYIMAYLDSLVSNRARSHLPYIIKDQGTLAYFVAPLSIGKQSRFISELQAAHIQTLIKNIDDLHHLLKKLELENRFAFITQLGFFHLTMLINGNHERLTSILKILPENDQLHFMNWLRFAYIEGLRMNSEQITHVLSALSPKNKMTWLQFNKLTAYKIQPTRSTQPNSFEHTENKETNSSSTTNDKVRTPQHLSDDINSAKKKPG